MDDRGFYCENCGEKLPAGSKFCPRCGAAVPDYGGNPASGYTQADATAANAAKRKRVLLYVILAAVIVVVIILLVVFLLAPGSVKLNQYMTIESSGTDGFGTVSCDFDYDAFYRDYAGKIELDSSSGYHIPDYEFYVPVELFYDDCVNWTVTYPDRNVTDGSLSNGDEVVVEWKCADSAAKRYFNKRLRYSNINYTVEGLAETEAINVFDYIDVVCSGKNSTGTATLEVSPSGEALGISAGDFDMSPTTGISNGTNITVRYNDSAAEKLGRNEGMAPTEMERIYAVEGLAEEAETPAETTKDTGNTGGTGNTGNSQTTGNAGSIAGTGNTGGVGTSEYLCPYSSSRLITASDISVIRAAGNYGVLPAGESLVQMIINEIYARHGYRFATSAIQAYFNQKSWYNAIGSYESNMQVVWNRLSSIEKQNVDYLSTLL